MLTQDERQQFISKTIMEIKANWGREFRYYGSVSITKACIDCGDVVIFCIFLFQDGRICGNFHECFVKVEYF